MDQFILLLVSSLLLTARAAADASNPVLDVDGHEVRRGRLYYAMSVKEPQGGLTLAVPKDPNHAPCPLNVGQKPSDTGRPLAFFPEGNTDDDTVREGNTLYIMFPEPTKCSQSTVWALDRQAGLVSTGGTKSSAVGPHDSRFAIRKAAGDASSASQREYQIEVCPCTIGVARPSCKMGCVSSLGLEKGEEKIALVINNERPHTIRFVKANAVKAASS